MDKYKVCHSAVKVALAEGYKDIYAGCELFRKNFRGYLRDLDARRKELAREERTAAAEKEALDRASVAKKEALDRAAAAEKEALDRTAAAKEQALERERDRAHQEALLEKKLAQAKL